MFDPGEVIARDLEIQRATAARAIPILVAELTFGTSFGGIAGAAALYTWLGGEHAPAGAEILVLFLAAPAIGIGAAVGLGAAAATTGVF